MAGTEVTPKCQASTNNDTRPLPNLRIFAMKSQDLGIPSLLLLHPWCAGIVFHLFTEPDHPY